jgi:hypothetical protein
MRKIAAAALLGLFTLPLFLIAAADTPEVSIDVGKDALAFKLGGEVVTRYHFGESVAKPYFWPLLAPGNIPVTRAWPMDKNQPGDATDHPHQKSAWFCHGDVIPEGIDLKTKVKGVTGVDFWSETPGHGTIVCVKVGEPKSEKGHAWIVTENEWRTADGVKVLVETRTLHLYAIPGGRLIVVDSVLKASSCPVTFGDTKEGSFGVRVRTELQADSKGKGILQNADDKLGEGASSNREKTGCWGLISNWCDASGPVDGKTVGVAVLADPGNPIKSAWHARGYGLVAANPFGRTKAGFPDLSGKTDLVKMAKGESLKFRYGIYLHEGQAKAGKVPEAFESFVKLGK